MNATLFTLLPSVAAPAPNRPKFGEPSTKRFRGYAEDDEVSHPQLTSNTATSVSFAWFAGSRD